ncbi:MAG: serine/threonine-protein kinase, partial [Luteimonas sp.]
MNTRAERWRQVSDLFDRVADLPAAQREAVLSVACADDPALRAEVERLLAADQLTNPLDHDIAGKASALLLEGDPEQHYGQLFGPYRIERLLGQGGMGRVYLAQREGDDFTQTVALKLVGGVGSFNAELARQRFVEERRLLARLEHPNIARLLDGGVGPEAQPWFAMEYVDGAPLTEYCDTHQLGVIARLTLFAKICDAVDHAHRFLIVHRDLKPGNLLVDARGEPKVLDFGIAKLLNDEGQQSADASTILMTPDYAAPEQIRGGQISTATDVYALGAVLFEVLTGHRPFKDALASREPPIASKVLTEDKTKLTQRASACATTPQALKKALRGDLDRIVRTALDPEPARRYGSAAALAQDLRAVVAGQPISLRSDR